MMILNVFSITEIFLGMLSVILMTGGGVLSFSLAKGWRRASTPEQKAEIEKRSHLVLLVAVVVMATRLLNWPLFYATLQSFVPEIDGAMCIFGVTQVKRGLTGFAEIVKPVSFFLIGGWLLLHTLDRRTQTSALMERKLLLLGFTSLVVVGEALMDVMLMFEITPGILVSCCTTVTDIMERPTRLVPQSLFGPSYERVVGIGYYAGTMLLMTFLALRLLRRGRRAPVNGSRLVPGLLFLLAIGNAFIFLLAQVEVHAPQIMGLPFHHCLYCLWQYVPDTVLMYALFFLGTCAVGWAFLLDILGRTEETREYLSGMLRALYGFSLFCLGASLVMNTVHLIGT